MVMTLLGIVLIALSGLALYLEKVTHQEFLLHIAAIPLEILVGAVLVERFIALRERSRRKKQLSYIKGYLFRFDMRRIFLLNFDCVGEPAISIGQIRRADIDGLQQLHDTVQRTEIQLKSFESLDLVLNQYIANRHVFEYFMEWSIRNDFEAVFHNMIYILNFIQHLKVLKDVVPDIKFAEEACGETVLFRKIKKILKDNLLSFLDYAIELKRERPDDFAELLEEYELTARHQPISRPHSASSEAKEDKEGAAAETA